MTVSAGSSDADFARMVKCVEAAPNIFGLCLDVANGYSEAFVHFVRKVHPLSRAIH